mmetsp:Transcript_105598/g.192620  ORF Transcript_105598/g.192620 Transcript_105598/m.192620 type:complete len:350 (+) Transcript_105598:658-1707(+)
MTSIHSRITALPTDDSSRKRTSNSPVISRAQIPVLSANCFRSCCNCSPQRSHSTNASGGSTGSSASVLPRWYLCNLRVSQTRFSGSPMRSASASSLAASSGEGAIRFTVSTKDQACATSSGIRKMRGHGGTLTTSGGPAAAWLSRSGRMLCTTTRQGVAATSPEATSCSQSRPLTMNAAIGGGGEPNKPILNAGCAGPSSMRSLTTIAPRAPASLQSQTAVAQSGVAGERWIAERSSSTTACFLPALHSRHPISCPWSATSGPSTKSSNRVFQIAGTTGTSTRLLLLVAAEKLSSLALLLKTAMRPATGTCVATCSKLPSVTRLRVRFFASSAMVPAMLWTQSSSRNSW